MMIAEAQNKTRKEMTASVAITFEAKTIFSCCFIKLNDKLCCIECQ